MATQVATPAQLLSHVSVIAPQAFRLHGALTLEEGKIIARIHDKHRQDEDDKYKVEEYGSYTDLEQAAGDLVHVIGKRAAHAGILHPTVIELRPGRETYLLATEVALEGSRDKENEDAYKILYCDEAEARQWLAAVTPIKAINSFRTDLWRQRKAEGVKLHLGVTLFRVDCPTDPADWAVWKETVDARNLSHEASATTATEPSAEPTTAVAVDATLNTVYVLRRLAFSGYSPEERDETDYATLEAAREALAAVKFEDPGELDGDDFKVYPRVELVAAIRIQEEGAHHYDDVRIVDAVTAELPTTIELEVVEDNDEFFEKVQLAERRLGNWAFEELGIVENAPGPHLPADGCIYLRLLPVVPEGEAFQGRFNYAATIIYQPAGEDGPETILELPARQLIGTLHLAKQALKSLREAIDTREAMKGAGIPAIVDTHGNSRFRAVAR